MKTKLAVLVLVAFVAPILIAQSVRAAEKVSPAPRRPTSRASRNW